MTRKADAETFIRRAEELNARLGSNALLGADRYLDPEHWTRRCKTTAAFHVMFHMQLDQALAFLLANPDAEQPPILRFLATAELEKRFPPLDLSAADYGPVTATLNYVVAKVVVGLLSGGGAPAELAGRAEAAFEALWALRGADRMHTRERWKAYQLMLRLAFGERDAVIRAFEGEHRLELAESENSDRTVIKECYMLSRIAAGTADEDMVFGARSYNALLKFDYYLWKVNEDLSAEIGLAPLVLMGCLYEQIASGALPDHRKLFASMAPRAVVEEMERLKRA